MVFSKTLSLLLHVLLRKSRAQLFSPRRVFRFKRDKRRTAEGLTVSTLANTAAARDCPGEACSPLAPSDAIFELERRAEARRIRRALTLALLNHEAWKTQGVICGLKKKTRCLHRADGRWVLSPGRGEGPNRGWVVVERSGRGGTARQTRKIQRCDALLLRPTHCD